jgi:ABC-type uncharacterized transport system ATPase subunit
MNIFTHKFDGWCIPTVNTIKIIKTINIYIRSIKSKYKNKLNKLNIIMDIFGFMKVRSPMNIEIGYPV